MSKNYVIIIQFVLPLTTFYRSGAQRNNVYKRDAFVTLWRSHNRAWQPQRHDRLSETSGTLWIPQGALTNQRCSLATGCGIIHWNLRIVIMATLSSLVALQVVVVTTCHATTDKLTTKATMTSSNGNIFCVTGRLCREFTSHWSIPLTKASEADICAWINS